MKEELKIDSFQKEDPTDGINSKLRMAEHNDYWLDKKREYSYNAPLVDADYEQAVDNFMRESMRNERFNPRKQTVGAKTPSAIDFRKLIKAFGANLVDY